MTSIMHPHYAFRIELDAASKSAKAASSNLEPMTGPGGLDPRAVQTIAIGEPHPVGQPVTATAGRPSSTTDLINPAIPARLHANEALKALDRAIAIGENNPENYGPGFGIPNGAMDAVRMAVTELNTGIRGLDTGHNGFVVGKAKFDSAANWINVASGFVTPYGK